MGVGLERRPDAYLYSLFIEGVEQSIHLKDAKDPMTFGEQSFHDDDDHSNTREWLWTFHGQLLVTSIPYLQEKHYATSPLQLLALVLELEKLHQRGYVRGDTRGFHTIVRNDTQGEFTATRR
jgi:hypothetical protein